MNFNDLFDFQAEDVEKLGAHPCRLIGSEMGTGKTYEGVALDDVAGSSKTLVVAPLSVLPVWDEHFKALSGREGVVIDPKDRDRSFELFKKSDSGLFMVHWDVLRLMPELRTVNWDHIIGDEVHRAQNRKAQQTQALKKIKTKNKTGLSGTPLTNRPDQFWSSLNWLYPDRFSSYWRFYKQHVDFEIVYPQGYHKIAGPKDEDVLLDSIDPFYVRHLKREECCPHHPHGVQPQLPEKYYTEQWVDLHPKQRRAYRDMERDMLAWVGEQEDTPLVASVVVAKLVRLAQFAVAYMEYSNDRWTLGEPSAKLDALMDILEDNPNKQFVIFSQFKTAIKLLERRLAKAGISYVTLTGDTPQPDRGPFVQRFQNGRARVFAGTIQAGGVGITLHAASTAIFLDRTWSPAVNVQAEDRLHRIGQKDAVQIIDLMAKSTVDLGRQQQLIQKWSWIKRMLGDA
jgi:SNF2 family DNA or RNA helicase